MSRAADFFFFLCYGMQEEAHEDATPMNLERSLHYRREGGIIDQEKGWRA